MLYHIDFNTTRILLVVVVYHIVAYIEGWETAVQTRLALALRVPKKKT